MSTSLKDRDVSAPPPPPKERFHPEKPGEWSIRLHDSDAARYRGALWLLAKHFNMTQYQAIQFAHQIEKKGFAETAPFRTFEVAESKARAFLSNAKSYNAALPITLVKR